VKRDALKIADVIFDYIPLQNIDSNLPLISNACKKDAIIAVRADVTHQKNYLTYKAPYNVRDGRDKRLICISK
jgi:hypothetical protein